MKQKNLQFGFEEPLRKLSNRLMPRLYLTVLTTRNETLLFWKRISKF